MGGRRLGMITLRLIGLLLMVVVVPPMSAQEQWNFDEPRPDHLFGPSFWVVKDNAQLTISCMRFTPDILPHPSGVESEPVLLPRRLEVGVYWIAEELNAPPRGQRPTIAGTTYDIRVRPFTDILWSIDDGRVMLENWKTFAGRRQYIQNNFAVRFLLQLLPPAAQLTVAAEFTDGETRSETFSLAGIDELLARMAPDCVAVQPLLAWIEPAL